MSKKQQGDMMARMAEIYNGTEVDDHGNSRESEKRKSQTDNQSQASSWERFSCALGGVLPNKAQKPFDPASAPELAQTQQRAAAVKARKQQQAVSSNALVVRGQSQPYYYSVRDLQWKPSTSTSRNENLLIQSFMTPPGPDSDDHVQGKKDYDFWMQQQQQFSVSSTKDISANDLSNALTDIFFNGPSDQSTDVQFTGFSSQVVTTTQSVLRQRSVKGTVTLRDDDAWSSSAAKDLPTWESCIVPASSSRGPPMGAASGSFRPLPSAGAASGSFRPLPSAGAASGSFRPLHSAGAASGPPKSLSLPSASTASATSVPPTSVPPVTATAASGPVQPPSQLRMNSLPNSPSNFMDDFSNVSSSNSDIDNEDDDHDDEPKTETITEQLNGLAVSDLCRQAYIRGLLAQWGEENKKLDRHCSCLTGCMTRVEKGLDWLGIYNPYLAQMEELDKLQAMLEVKIDKGSVTSKERVMRDRLSDPNQRIRVLLESLDKSTPQRWYAWPFQWLWQGKSD